MKLFCIHKWGTPFFLCFLLCSVVETSAQVRNNREATIGLGYTSPSELNPLNIAGDAPMNPSLIGNMGVRWPVSDQILVGLRGTLTINKRSGYVVQYEDGRIEQDVSYRLTTFNLGTDGLFFISKDRTLKPYVLALLAYSGGILADKRTATIQHQGYVLGGGIGIRLAASKSLSIGVEVIQTFGASHWKQLPFQNSDGSSYDPSTLMILTNTTFN